MFLFATSSGLFEILSVLILIFLSAGLTDELIFWIGTVLAQKKRLKIGSIFLV